MPTISGKGNVCVAVEKFILMILTFFSLIFSGIINLNEVGQLHLHRFNTKLVLFMNAGSQ